MKRFVPHITLDQTRLPKRAIAAIKRLDFLGQWGLLRALISSLLFLRPHDRTAAEVAHMISQAAREIAEEECGHE